MESVIFLDATFNVTIACQLGFLFKCKGCVNQGYVRVCVFSFGIVLKGYVPAYEGVV